MSITVMCPGCEDKFEVDILDVHESAAEIERLTAENEATRKDRDDLLQQALGVEAERDIARMENERLRAALLCMWDRYQLDVSWHDKHELNDIKKLVDTLVQQQITKEG